MARSKKQELIVKDSAPIDLDLVSDNLKSSVKKLASDIVMEEDANKVKDLTAAFNMAQAKKNILRTLKFNDLLDLVSDKMVERFIKRPDEFSHKDLIDYMNVVINALDKSSKNIKVDDADAIQINQQNNIQVNMNESGLDRESRAKVAEAIQAILNRATIDNIVDSSDDDNYN